MRSFKRRWRFFSIGVVIALACAIAGSAQATGFKGIWHAGGKAADLFFLPYELGSNEGAIVLDGRITHDDGLGLPFSREHKGGKTGTPMTGWVKDDGDHLYIALDISSSGRAAATTGDASVFIKQPGGVMEYRFGSEGMFETLEGKRRHRVFEFKIPLDDIKVSKGAVELAFMMDAPSRG